jgi:MFS family permease
MRNWSAQLKATYREYPGPFWILTGATFIDRLGGALLFPFFSLYVTEKFGVGMTQVGVLFAVFSIANMVGSVLSGALTDRLGRRWMLLFGLVISALSSLIMGFIDRLELFYLGAGMIGLFVTAGGPAQQAMVADLLPEEKRGGGFGLIRVAVNLAVTIGPAIGGLLAARSYLTLFIADAVSSLVTAAIVYFTLPETKPEPAEGQAEQTFAESLRGYRVVGRDVTYMLFILASILLTSVYMQMNTTLSVFLRDVHGVPARGYGLLLSLNAGMVVAFQFWISRRISRYAPFNVLALGALLYAVGFGMYGFVAGPLLFATAMVIITVGEMVLVPTGQALVARMAPADMRGRYMAVFGLSWALPTAFAPLLAGLIMDNYNPNWVWYAGGLVAALAAGGYFLLRLREPGRLGVEQAGA